MDINCLEVQANLEAKMDVPEPRGSAADRDRFGNVFAPTLSYARGNILADTTDDFRRLQQAWRYIGRRSQQEGRPVNVFTGLEHHLPMRAEDLELADDEIAPAFYYDRLKALAIDHLGGNAAAHDIAVFNRITGATLATFLTLVKAGETVIGSSATISHPSVIRAGRHVGARFIDTSGANGFERTLDREERVALVALTRLATTYDLLSLEDIRRIVKRAQARKIPVYVDDAGGARVGPAIFDQPKMLDLGVDIGATGLDKYGTVGPRLGLMAGDKTMVAKIRAKGFECGLEARQFLYPAVVRTLEAYSPQRVRDLVAATKQVAAALRPRFGDRLHETPVTVQLLAEDILEMVMQRGGVNEPPIVPYEANAALCMLMLRDYGMLTVHFVGVPPGGANLLLKFIPPETLQRFGGANKFAEALDASLSKLGSMLRNPKDIRQLLLGEAV
jgi:L-seryl-tRNA(Ser) seleniumtransferase